MIDALRLAATVSHYGDGNKAYSNIGHEIIRKPRETLKPVAEPRAASKYRRINFLNHEALPMSIAILNTK
jgi:hypothetical protein